MTDCKDVKKGKCFIGLFASSVGIVMAGFFLETVEGVLIGCVLMAVFVIGMLGIFKCGKIIHEHIERNNGTIMQEAQDNRETVFTIQEHITTSSTRVQHCSTVEISNNVISSRDIGGSGLKPVCASSISVAEFQASYEEAINDMAVIDTSLPTEIQMFIENNVQVINIADITPIS